MKLFVVGTVHYFEGLFVKLCGYDILKKAAALRKLYLYFKLLWIDRLEPLTATTTYEYEVFYLLRKATTSNNILRLLKVKKKEENYSFRKHFK